MSPAGIRIRVMYQMNPMQQRGPEKWGDFAKKRVPLLMRRQYAI